MKTVRSCVVAALVCAAGFAGSGCSKKAQGSDEKSGAGPAGAAAPALGLYVQCFNEVEHRVHDSWKSYVEWVDPKVGPTGKEKMIDGIRQIDDYQTGKCLENIAQALAAGGTGTLVEPTRAYQTALTALLPIVKETKEYYEHKDYKDDGFAKGKQLHAKLIPAFEAWNTANVAMRTTWDGQHRAQRAQDLATLEKKLGRKSEEFVSAQVMMKAEELIETVTSSKDPQVLQNAIAAYQTAFDEMNGFFGPALTASTDTDRYVFKRDADELLIQTKEAARVLKSSKPLPAEGDGSEAKLMEEYNDLVEQSNSITWD
jgi:hypothetical protein